MGSLKRISREFEDRLSRAVHVERPEWVFNRVMAEGTVDIVFKISDEPSISIVADSQADHKQVTFHFIKDSIYIKDRRRGSADIVGNLVKSSNPLKRILRLFGIGSHRANQVPPVLVCISQSTVPHLSHMGSGTVVMENLDQYQILIRSEGVANILASGKVFSVGAQQDGVGNIDLSNLLTTKAHLNLSGTGSIHASVSENVENEITGTGTITVAGNPMIRGQTVTGTGRVEYV